MWKFTELADWFDRNAVEENRWVDSQIEPLVASTLYANSPWYRNVGIWMGAGTLYSVNKMSTTVASGFVDVLRLGDGVKEGGWGYGKDALRLLILAGPVLRGARWAVSVIPAVDVSPRVGNCTWVAAARLLRLTGTRPLAQISNLAAFDGLKASQTAGAWPENLMPMLRLLGANVRAGEPIANMKDLTRLVSRNPQAATLFSVQWTMAGKDIGHSLIAVRDFMGAIRIIDRSGRVVRTLAELDRTYPGIGAALFHPGTVIAENSRIVKSLSTVPSFANIVSHAADLQASAPVPVPPTVPGALATVTPKSAGGPLSPLAQKIYKAMGPGHSVLSYREIWHRSGVSLDGVAAGIDELRSKGKVMTITGSAEEDRSMHRASRL